MLFYINAFVFSVLFSAAHGISSQISFERADLIYYDDKVIFINVSLTHISRTVKALSEHIFLYEDLPEDSMGKIMVLVEHNNQYHHSPINIQAKLCELFSADLKVVKKVVPEGTILPDSCPIKKGIMTNVKDLVLDGSFIPPNMNLPWKKTKVVFKIYYGKRRLIGHLHFYINFDHDYALARQYY